MIDDLLVNFHKRSCSRFVGSSLLAVLYDERILHKKEPFTVVLVFGFKPVLTVGYGMGTKYKNHNVYHWLLG